MTGVSGLYRMRKLSLLPNRKIKEGQRQKKEHTHTHTHIHTHTHTHHSHTPSISHTVRHCKSRQSETQALTAMVTLLRICSGILPAKFRDWSRDPPSCE